MAPAPGLTSMEDEIKPNIVVKSEYIEISQAENAIDKDCMPFLSKNEDVKENGEKLNVDDCSEYAEGSLIKYDDPDPTECSSSFGNTCSGSDCDSKRDLDDMEIDSPLSIPKDFHVTPDGFSRVLKKKKVTDHWGKYINPIRWRCQWLELQMNELLSQHSKYEKELAPYRHEKEVMSKMVELNSSASRTVPMAFRCQTKEKMMRRKRKRDEDNIDLSTYMSNHVLFSYNEDNKPENQLVMDDDSGDEENSKNVDIEGLVDAMRSDSSFYEILLKIEILRNKVSKVKANLNKVISRNTTEIPLYPGNFLLDSIPERCVRSVSGSPINNGDAAMELYTSPHRVSENEIEEAVMTDSSVSSYGDDDDFDGGFGLSCIHDLLSQQHILDFCKDDDDDILIDNQNASLDFRLDHAIDRAPGMTKEFESHSRGESMAPSSSQLKKDTTSKTIIVSQQATLKPCYSEKKNPLPTQGSIEIVTALRAAEKPSYTGKKRGRKPKKKRLVGYAAAANSARRERLV